MMRKPTLAIVASLLCCLQCLSQSHDIPNVRGDLRDALSVSIPVSQDGVRNMPSTPITVRTFTYDAAGNRILMETPSRNVPASQGTGQLPEVQAILTLTSGMLKVSLPGEIPEPYSISVYTAAGQFVAERKGCTGRSQDISLSRLSRGVHIIDICAEDIRHTTKLIMK